MTFSQLLIAASIAYGYSDADKAAVRELAIKDRAGVHAALLADPWLPWVAYEHGITDTPPVRTSNAHPAPHP